MKYKLIILFFICFCIAFLYPLRNLSQLKEQSLTTSLVEPHIELIVVNDKTVFTAYTLSVQETDETPCTGAGGNLCDIIPLLIEKGITICASRDLPLDTVIYIEGFGECLIKDRMNKRYKGTFRVDILFDSREEALRFGKRELNYVIVK